MFWKWRSLMMTTSLIDDVMWLYFFDIRLGHDKSEGISAVQAQMHSHWNRVKLCGLFKWAKKQTRKNKLLKIGVLFINVKTEVRKDTPQWSNSNEILFRFFFYVDAIKFDFYWKIWSKYFRSSAMSVKIVELKLFYYWWRMTWFYGL